MENQNFNLITSKKEIAEETERVDEIMKITEESEEMLRRFFEMYESRIKNSEFHSKDFKEKILKRLTDVSERLKKHKKENIEELKAMVGIK